MRSLRPRALFATLTMLSLALVAFPGSPESLPVRGPSSASEGTGVLLSDAIRAYVRFMRMPGVFIDPSVPRRHVNYVVQGLTPQEAFDELMQANGLTSIIDARGALHVGSVAAIGLQFGPSRQPLIIRSGTPTTAIPILQAVTHGRVAFVPDDAMHTLYAIGKPEDIALASAFLNTPPTVSTEIVPLKAGISSDSLLKTLASYTSDGSGLVRSLPDRNAIVITGDPAYIATMKDQIALFDSAPSEVFYTISFVEITPQEDSVLRGINLGPLVAGREAAGANTSGGTTSSTGYSLAGGAVNIGQFSASLDALQSEGRARVLERTTITATSGTQAVSDFTQQTPIIIYDQLTGIGTPRTVDSGVKLSITPQIGTDGVTTSISADFSEITGYASNGYPNLAQRSSQNTVVTHDGETVVISGLYAVQDLNTWTSNPPFSYLPIFGGIFHHRDASQLNNEVIIVATPTIARPGVRGPSFDFPAIPQELIDNGIAPHGATPNPVVPPEIAWPTTPPKPTTARRSLTQPQQTTPRSSIRTSPAASPAPDASSVTLTTGQTATIRRAPDGSTTITTSTPAPTPSPTLSPAPTEPQ